MRVLRFIGRSFWRFMVIFSFVVNIILVITLLVLLLVIFDIKKNIAQPLVQGLHSSFVGLNDSTIDWTIPVTTKIPLNQNLALDTSIPLNTVIPLNTDTMVVLTQPVPLNVPATVVLNGAPVSTTVSLTLPVGLQLPVHLNLDVPVNLQVPIQQDVAIRGDIPVDLKVRAVIPLSQTQLHDPVENLRLLFEPLVRVLGNLPDNFGDVGPFVGRVLSGSPPNLLAETPYSKNPWPGFSQTAGLNYTEGNQPIPPENVPVLTGIQPVGGIPALDQGIRPELYADGKNPQAANAQSVPNVPPETYNGHYGDTINSPRKQAEAAQNGGQAATGDGRQAAATPEVPGTNPTAQVPATPATDGRTSGTPVAPGGDLGIVSPTQGGP
jgi:hypothetical protein